MRLTVRIALPLLLLATSAQAQREQVAVHLNDPTGLTQYLSVTNKTGLEGFTSYTLEAWVRPTSVAGAPTILGNDYRSSYWLGLGTAGRVRFYPRGGLGQFFEGATAIPVNQWTHVAVTYNTVTGGQIFLNGVLDGSSNTFLGAVGSSTGDLRIGADREEEFDAYHWHGAIDEVRIWNVVRSATEIRDHMKIGLGSRRMFVNGRYDALVALWDMYLPFVTAVPDIAGEDETHSNLATFVGGDYTMVHEPGPPMSMNTALALNGIDDHAVLPMADGFADGLTIDAWVAPTSFANFPTIAGRDFETSFWLGLSPTGRVRFYPAGGLSEYFESNLSIPLNAWSHVAVTYRPGDAVIYLNGRANAASTDFTSPVGENGRDVWIGADNIPGETEPAYPFTGYLDNVRISRGVWSGEQIRTRRLLGYESFAQPIMHEDHAGTPRETWAARFGQRETGPGTILGSGARLVRSGATLTPTGAGIAPMAFAGYALGHAVGTALPDGTSSFHGTNLFIQRSGTITSTRVFVSTAATQLANTLVQVRSPAGTTVELLTPGHATGSDLHTVFDDASPHTLASGFAPYYHGVRPSALLSAWNGENSVGSWRFEISVSGSATARVGLWAWGLQFNNQPLSAPGAAPTDVALRNTGGNPVRGAGQVTFTLPRAASADLTLHDAQGRRVRTLLAGPQTAGTFALGWNAGDLAPGAYFLRLTVDGEQAASLRVSVVR